MTEQRRSLEVSRARGVTFARLSGEIDEHSGPELQRLARLRGVVVIDLDSVTRITSFGVREWVRALDASAADYYCFARCRPVLVAQFNMIRNFARRGELVSLYAPYACRNCDETLDVLIDLRREDQDLNGKVASRVPCPRCQGPAEFDDVAESYLSYAVRAAPPRPPPEVAAVLSVPFRVDKEVTAELTVLWLIGTLDAAARLKRAIDGLDGRVLVIMQDVLFASADGARTLEALFNLPAASVEIAHVPLGVAQRLLEAPGGFGKAKVVSVKIASTCERCLLEQSVEITADDLANVGLERPARCKECGNALSALPDEAQLRALPWAKLDAIANAYLTSASPTADGFDSVPRLTKPQTDPKELRSSTGSYEIVKVLGRGGMGSVYLARAVRAGGFERLVAIERMHPHLAEEPDCVAMFLDEARLAARIHHPNVVPTLDVAHGPDGVLLLMDYVAGLPLGYILEHGSRLPIEVALRILFDALAGLHAAHELRDEDGSPMNLVHRDMSCQNLLVGVDGTTRVADFGIALAKQRLATTTAPGHAKGTLGYLAPEQARCGHVDRRADIFAMGFVAYVSLVAGSPIDSLLDSYSLHEQLTRQLAGGTHGFSPIAEAFVRVCVPALALEPAHRYPTALAFLEALEEAAKACGVTVGPSTSRAVGALVESLIAVEAKNKAAS